MDVLRCNLLRLVLLFSFFCGGAVSYGGDGMNEPENRTEAFLGGRSRWVNARVELYDVQGLFGGRNVLVTGTGTVLVQVVSPAKKGLEEKRYARVAAGTPDRVPPEVTELLERAVRRDFVTIRSDDRPGIPDEARIEIVLTNGDGDSREVAFWESTPVLPMDSKESDGNRFHSIYAGLKRFQSELEKSGKPVYQGAYKPGGWGKWVRKVLGPSTGEK